jgi:biopolymer transport protein ExbB/TolQ
MLAIAFLAVALGLAVAGLFRAMSQQTESLVEDLADDLEDGRAQ